MMQYHSKNLFIAALFNLVFISSASADQPVTTQVFNNIFTITHGEGMDSNATFIITDEGVMVIDTRVSPQEGQKLLEEIRKHTDKPIRYVVNTHYYGSHTLGNQVFREAGATIIAHHNVQRAMGGKRIGRQVDWLQMKGVPGLKEVKVTPPNFAFYKRLDIILGGVQMKLIRLGPAQTDGDTIVFLPDLQAVITGGLVLNRKIPFLDESDVEGWIKALFQIEDLQAEIIIPGYGDVGHKPITTQMRHYFLELKQQVQASIQKNKTLEETLEEVRPFFKNKYGHWEGQERLDDNIKKAYQEYTLKEDATTPL